jgi:aldehyde dehydrogenase (NAD+)
VFSDWNAPLLQICVAPDYVLIPRSAQDDFIEAIKEAAAKFHPDGALASDSYASIVSEGHYKRLQNLMTKSSGKIVIGGNTDEQKRRIAPTVFKDVEKGDALLEGYVALIPVYLFTHSRV